jgi:hypothetical protein
VSERFSALLDRLRRVARRFERVLPGVLLFFIALLAALALLSPGRPWPLSIEASTEQLRIDLDGGGDTLWRVQGATICALVGTEDLGVLEEADGARICPGRWRAYSIPSGEWALRLMPPSSTVPAASVHMTIEPDGIVVMAIRRPVSTSRAEASNGIWLESPGGSPLALGREVILAWPPASAAPARLVLPFSGEITIGRDVQWSNDAMLRAGKVRVFAQAEQEAGGRGEVSSTDLLLGDQVVLRPVGSGARPKGFIHADIGLPDSARVLSVVAFGGTDMLRIVRFGDPGYGFEPGWWARTTRHPAISVWLLVLVGALTLLAAYREASVRADDRPTLPSDVARPPAGERKQGRTARRKGRRDD